MMTMDAIKDDADMAETWPGSGVLNWNEIGFKTLAAWVALNPQQTVAATETFDVESVKGMFEDWWHTANAQISGSTPSAEADGSQGDGHA